MLLGATISSKEGEVVRVGAIPFGIPDTEAGEVAAEAAVGTIPFGIPSKRITFDP